MKYIFKYFFYLASFLIVYLSVNATSIDSIDKDKARYLPGTEVNFTLNIDSFESDLNVIVEYYYLDKKIFVDEFQVESELLNWKWNVPQDNYKGYLVNVSLYKSNILVDSKSIAVDVSSDWSKFPRYGFLSIFSPTSPTKIGAIINKLKRHHINGIQFYDWHYKHHLPIKGTAENPDLTWVDIANRTIYLPTVRNYVDSLHSKNMMAMAYNLIYGAYKDAEIDGVSNQWRIFSDQNHNNPDFHDLPNSWVSDIYLMNPNNELWQNHILNVTKDAFIAIDFDGWHVDQLGDRGARYDYSGNWVNIPFGFQSLLTEAKSSLNKLLVMNAVNQYAQSNIAESPVEFLYTEVWEPNTTFDKLAQIILNNDALTNNQLKTTLAAYVNRELSTMTENGELNTPAVLYADAVIFAFGGNHIELGEHYLANEYFPNDNLKMNIELENRLVNYYDFLVAYQNYLRGDGEIINEQLNTESDLNFIKWGRSFGVWNFVRKYQNKKVFQLINFSDASTLDWRDNLGTQLPPEKQVDVPVNYETDSKVYKVWLASPDYNNGVPKNLEFTQTNGKVSFKLPELKYWNMVVIDFDSATSVSDRNNFLNGYSLKQNYPNPFNPTTSIEYSVPSNEYVILKIFDILGNEMATLVNEQKETGNHKINFNASNYPSGLYIYSITAGNFNQVRKMMLLK